MLERIPKVQGVSSQEYPQAAQRPRYSVLDTAVITSYSIHYTKLYDDAVGRQVQHRALPL